MTEVVLDPLLVESMLAGTNAFIDQWLVSEGDHVHQGQILARANLAHTLVDVPAGHAGIVEEILLPVGSRFDRGAVLARLIHGRASRLAPRHRPRLLHAAPDAAKDCRIWRRENQNA